MSAVWMGYMLAVISSVFSAVYVVPKKLSKLGPVTYAMIMGVGFFIASAAGFAVLKALGYIDEPLLIKYAPVACINGVVWTVASVSVLSAIDKIGLAKSNQWKSLQGPVGAFLMLTFLSEFQTAKVAFILIAIILITLAAILFSTREKDNARVDKTGIIYALIAAVFYGISAALGKFLTNEGSRFSQQIYQSLFVVISAAAYILVREKTLRIKAPKIGREIALPLVGGVLFFGNSSFMILAYSYIEGSIVSMLHQLNAVWLLIIGVAVFREIDFKRYWPRLAGGLALSIAGVLMLILAKV